MKKANFTEKRVWAYGIISILAGIVLILTGLYIEKVMNPTSHPAVICIKLLEHLGIALISIGLVGIIVDFRDWQKYFQKQIAKTIIQRNYLETLSDSQLIDLQTDTLKAFFRTKDIEREGNFLDFFHSRIHNYIGSPYRENVTGDLIIRYSDDNQSFIVDEIFSYTCRKVGEFIQDTVRWGYENAEEIDKIDSFKVTLRIPDNFFQSPEFKTQYPRVDTPLKEFNPNGADDNLTKWEKGLGYTLSLREYKRIDRLYVTVSVRFIMPTNRILSWYMTHPSKILNATINYPPQLGIQLIAFGLDGNETHIERRDGHCTLRYTSWVLPTNGIAFYISESKIGASPIEQTKDSAMNPASSDASKAPTKQSLNV
jgi:hypothetical protein